MATKKSEPEPVDIPRTADEDWAPEGYKPGPDNPGPVEEETAHPEPEGVDEEYLAELERTNPVLAEAAREGSETQVIIEDNEVAEVAADEENEDA